MIYAIDCLSVIHVRRCYKSETSVKCLLIVSGKSLMNAIVATFCERSLICHAYFVYFSHKNYINYAKITQNRALLLKLVRSRGLSCSKPGIAHSTDPTNICGKLRRFHVRKTDEMRKSRMHRVRLEMCAIYDAFTRLLGYVTGP
jgi:hypothetical protein